MVQRDGTVLHVGTHAHSLAAADQNGDLTGAKGAALLFTIYVGQGNHLKTLLTSYEVTGGSLDEITQEVNRILEHKHRLMQNVESGSTKQHIRLHFDVTGCERDQKELLRELKASKVLGSVTSLGPVESE